MHEFRFLDRALLWYGFKSLGGNNVGSFNWSTGVSDSRAPQLRRDTGVCIKELWKSGNNGFVKRSFVLSTCSFYVVSGCIGGNEPSGTCLQNDIVSMNYI